MLFCKHQWKVLDKTVLPSAWEQMQGRIVEIGEHPLETYQKRLVLTVVCEKCGKLKVIVEVSPVG